MIEVNSKETIEKVINQFKEEYCKIKKETIENISKNELLSISFIETFDLLLETVQNKYEEFSGFIKNIYIKKDKKTEDKINDKDIK